MTKTFETIEELLEDVFGNGYAEDLDIKLHFAQKDILRQEAFLDEHKRHVCIVVMKLCIHTDDEIKLIEAFLQELKRHCKAVADILGVP